MKSADGGENGVATRFDLDGGEGRKSFTAWERGGSRAYSVFQVSFAKGKDGNIADRLCKTRSNLQNPYSR